MHIVLAIGRVISAILGITFALITALIVLGLCTTLVASKPGIYVGESVVILAICSGITLTFLRLGFPNIAENAIYSIGIRIECIRASLVYKKYRILYGIRDFTSGLINGIGDFVGEVIYSIRSFIDRVVSDIHDFVVYRVFYDVPDLVKARLYLFPYAILVFGLAHFNALKAENALKSWLILGSIYLCLITTQFLIFKARIPLFSLPYLPTPSDKGFKLGKFLDSLISFVGWSTFGLGGVIGAGLDDSENRKSSETYYASIRQSKQSHDQQVVILIQALLVDVFLGLFITLGCIYYSETHF